MPRLDRIRAHSRLSNILEGQPQHILMALMMVLGALWLLEPPFQAPTLLGLSTTGWAMTSIILALVHQGLASLLIVVAIVFIRITREN